MSTTPVTIRQATHSDIDSLTSLLQVLFSIEEDFSFDIELQNKGLQMMLDNHRGCLLAAEVTGEVIGMCSGQLTVSTAEGGPALLIEDLVVHEEYRDRGIGKQLLERIGDWGKQHGASRLQLLADRNNAAALNFYNALGWQTTELICMRKNM